MVGAPAVAAVAGFGVSCRDDEWPRRGYWKRCGEDCGAEVEGGDEGDGLLVCRCFEPSPISKPKCWRPLP